VEAGAVRADDIATLGSLYICPLPEMMRPCRAGDGAGALVLAVILDCTLLLLLGTRLQLQHIGLRLAAEAGVVDVLSIFMSGNTLGPAVPSCVFHFGQTYGTRNCFDTQCCTQ
jgi:hypothetical protein